MAKRERIERSQSIVAEVKALIGGQAGIVAWNVALFAAGVAFIQSTLMDNLAPQI